MVSLKRKPVQKTKKKVVKKTAPKKTQKKVTTQKKAKPKKTAPKKAVKSIVTKNNNSKKTLNKKVIKPSVGKKILEHPHSQKLKDVLKESKLAAIYSAILIIPAFFIGILLTQYNTVSMQILNFIIIALTLILSIYILRGYYGIADRHRTKFLQIMIYIALTLNVILAIFGTISLFAKTTIFSGLFTLILVFLTAVIYCMFGLSLWNLKNLVKGIIPSLCILYILIGLLYAAIYSTGMVFLLILLVGIAINILEAVLFHKLYKTY